MDIQVQELIEKIKKDGVQAASEEAALIRQKAEDEAAQILESAKKEAAEIAAKSKQDAARFEKAGIAALKQASRSLVLTFKGEIQAMVDGIVGEHIGKTYNADVLKAVLPELLKNWAVSKGDSPAVLVPESSLDKLQEFFQGKLAAQVKKGLEIKPAKNLSGGFRIVEKDGSAYYDFSADAVAELLCSYLNPRLSEILKSAVKEQG